VAAGPALDRLLGRTALEGLLAALEATAPGARARVVDATGRTLGGWRDDGSGNGRTGQPVAEHPIVAGGQQLGVLVVGPEAPAGVVDLTTRALVMAAEQALNVRFLAAETLERYRELNVLYDVGERIAGSLDPSAIAEIALAECRRVAAAGTGAVVVDGPAGPSVVAGDEPAAALLLPAATGLIERVRAAGSADIDSGAAVQAAGLGSILAVPLRTDQAVSGVLVLGRGIGRPTFTAGDQKLVAAVATQLAIALQNADLHVREVERLRMEDELAVGRQIQLDLLPLDDPQVEGWEIHAVYRAARQVGGDFYDYVPSGDGSGRLALIVGDVAGKGVPAALIMAYTRAVLRGSSSPDLGPGEVLDRANRSMLGECRRAALLVTVFYATLEPATGVLRYASAGHDWPVRLRTDGGTEFLGSDGFMLGAVERAEYGEHGITVEPGEVVVLYTDGITEARAPDGALFGDDRLVAALETAGGRDARGVAAAVMAAVDGFTAGAPQADDLTLIAVRRRPL
jgi:serine phosphatase RsbU (regulator of sigma subunit)